ASFSVWQPEQPALVKMGFPAVALPAAGGAGVDPVVVGVVAAGAVVAVFPPGASFFSLPNTRTAVSIAMKNSNPSTTYQPTPRPGNVGLRRGSTSDEIS